MSFLKDYEPVEDRLRAFWKDYPEGRITTRLLRGESGEYIVRAKVWRTDHAKSPDATGLAHDSVDELPANMKNSALEVCETSAIGRALANLGYAPKGKRPSREEMSKVSGGSALYGEGRTDSPESTSGAASPPDEAGSEPGVAHAPGSPATQLVCPPHRGPISKQLPDGRPTREGWSLFVGCGHAVPDKELKSKGAA